jgi:hypothetical protein
MRQVWNCKQNISLVILNVASTVLKRGNAIAYCPHLRNLVLCMLPGFLEPTNLLRNLIAFPAMRFNFLLRFSPPRVERKEFRQINRYASSGERGFDLFSIVSNKP